MTNKRQWSATYLLMTTDPDAAPFRALQAHAANWLEARQRLPRYIYPAGRRYRRISGPVVDPDCDR